MAAGLERRQVFDLPERLIAVTEHQSLVYACARCGERTRAASVYLCVQHLIPEDRTAEALADRIGAESLCGASVAEWTRRRAVALAPVVERIDTLIRAARVRCLDDPSTMLRTACAWAVRRNGCIPQPARP